MSDREAIHQYLKALNTYLARLQPHDAVEVEREIESHIYDVIEAQQGKGEVPQINDILAGFGSPRQLAEAYVSHILKGSPPPQGFSAIKSIQRGASSTLYWVTAILGYLTGALMIGLSFIKQWFPDHVGVWSSSDCNSFVIGLVDQVPSQTQELLGGWFTPVFIVLGFALMRLTYLILKAFKQN